MHEVTRRIIAEQLKSKGLSQRQLAILAGMNQSTLNRFLNSATDTLDFPHVVAIAHALNMTVSELIGETPLLSDPKIRTVAAAMKDMPEYKKDAIVAASNSLATPDVGTKLRK
ncbi:transcriptional regulator with XRE-family HTH domain [Pseudacidovorax sp. 1753]|uniref:helix-turn-helix domain-containing protein n=1 Tax=Pseudacidovorax sp. 1753 TaxID=3156419 RepID=UPI0033946B17